MTDKPFDQDDRPGPGPADDPPGEPAHDPPAERPEWLPSPGDDEPEPEAE